MMGAPGTVATPRATGQHKKAISHTGRSSCPILLNHWPLDRLYAEEVLLAAAARQVDDAGQREQLPGRQHRGALAQRPVIGVDAGRQPELVGAQPLGDDDAGAGPARPRRSPSPPGTRNTRPAWRVTSGPRSASWPPRDVLPQPAVVERARGQRRPLGGLAADQRHHQDAGDGGGVIPWLGQPAVGGEHRPHLVAGHPAEQRAVPRHRERWPRSPGGPPRGQARAARSPPAAPSRRSQCRSTNRSSHSMMRTKNLAAPASRFTSTIEPYRCSA